MFKSTVCILDLCDIFQTLILDEEKLSLISVRLEIKIKNEHTFRLVVKYILCELNNVYKLQNE